MDEKLLNSPEMTAKLIGNRPNTYTYTKVTENRENELGWSHAKNDMFSVHLYQSAT